MAVIRAFIAIDIPATIQSKLDKISQQMQSQCASPAIRWVPAKNIHLTLKFLGEVSSSNLEVLRELLRSETARHRSFEISIGTLGAFPSILRPRVIWIGVQAPSDLLTLQHSVEGEIVRLGYIAEERPFSAHLTLARISHNASPEEVRRIGQMLASLKVGVLGTFTVDSVHLFRSDLQPGGAIYTSLFSAPLIH